MENLFYPPCKDLDFVENRISNRTTHQISHIIPTSHKNYLNHFSTMQSNASYKIDLPNNNACNKLPADLTKFC